jgi:hypothetical protein
VGGGGEGIMQSSLSRAAGARLAAGQDEKSIYFSKKA